MPDPSIIILIVVLLFSVVVHEVAHGWAADRLGDPTARNLGRLTLNPIMHIDLFWTILLPVILYMSMGVLFGGAKPVPVNPYNFKNAQKGMAITAAAGPLSNLILAIIGLLLFKLFIQIQYMPEFLSEFLQYFVFINGILMGFNLIPIPPLDGSKVLMGFMDYQTAAKYESLSQYGFFILMGLILVGDLIGIHIFGMVLDPLINLINYLMYGI